MSKINTNMKSALTVLLLMVIVTTAFPQAPAFDNTAKEIIEQAEIIYGTDDRLINGEFYQNTKIINRGHPNFSTNMWAKGPLFIKGVAYTDVSIKYNIEIDKVILLAQFSSGNIMQLALNNSSIDSMYVGDHFFINSDLVSNDLTGFCEPIYKGSFEAYLKHTKSFLSRSDASSAGSALNTGSYQKMKTALYIVLDNRLVKIHNKKALYSLFPIKKNALSKFISKNRVNFRNLNSNQLINLLKYCDEI